MADLELVNRLAAGDHNLAVFTTARLDGSVHASVVSAGVIDDPIDGHAGVGAVVGGATRKLTLLRQSGTASVVFKNGFEWAAVTRSGAAHRTRGRDGVRARRARGPAVGLPGGRGTHDDWAEFDRVMAEDCRCAVFVGATKITSNPTR